MLSRPSSNNFGTANRHGIFREIPKLRPNAEGKNYVLDYRLQSITDEAGNAYSYENESTSKLFKYRIGDADKTITGQHTYVISYEVSGALTYFSDHDELYWNIMGNEWKVPIAAASATIQLPSTIPTDSIKLVCYTGPAGSTATQCDHRLDASTALFTTNDTLYAYEGLTVRPASPWDMLTW